MTKIFDFTLEPFLDKHLQEIAGEFEKGKIVIFPTDTVIAIGCIWNNKDAIDKILTISNKIDKKGKLTILCKDIKMVSDFTLPFSSQVFQTLKTYTPGPVTFIMNANKTMTRILKIDKPEIAVRIPSHPVLKGIIDILGQPIVSTSLPFVSTEAEYFDGIENKYKNQVDVIIKEEIEKQEESTILDCTKEEIELIREGKTIIEYLQ